MNEDFVKALYGMLLIGIFGTLGYFWHLEFKHHLDCQLRPQMITAAWPCDQRSYPAWREGGSYYEKYPEARGRRQP